MKIRFLNKTIEHQRFNFNPRYYNERKEKLNRIKDQYEKSEDKNLSDEERKALFKDNLKENWSRGQYRQSQTKSSNFRIVMLIGIIVALGYFLFNCTGDVDTIVKKIW